MACLLVYMRMTGDNKLCIVKQDGGKTRPKGIIACVAPASTDKK